MNVINFIDGLTAKGLKSIHRTNLSQKLKEMAEQFFNNQELLSVEYKVSGNEKDFKREVLELAEQERVIDSSEYEKEIEVIKELVKPLLSEGSEHEFSGGDALAVQILYYALGLNE